MVFRRVFVFVSLTEWLLISNGLFIVHLQIENETEEEEEDDEYCVSVDLIRVRLFISFG